MCHSLQATLVHVARASLFLFFGWRLGEPSSPPVSRADPWEAAAAAVAPGPGRREGPPQIAGRLSESSSLHQSLASDPKGLAQTCVDGTKPRGRTQTLAWVPFRLFPTSYASG
ncbi:hypothetical protein MRX96_017728 [Rhipicephalus microplus]